MAGEISAATDLLRAITDYGDDGDGRAPKLATVDAGYTTGLVRVRFDGESTVSGKGYAWLASYTPAAGDRVALLPVGTSYLILGRVRAS